MKFTYWTLLLIALVACKEAPKTQSETQPEAMAEPEVAIAEVESAIPSFDFDSFSEEYLRKENDTTYVVNFWATWCKPCVKELPYFEQVHAENLDKPLKVVLVSLDFPDKVNDLVVPFIEKKGLKSEVVLLNDDDHNRWIPLVSDKWSGAIPATVVVKNGQAVFKEGSHTYESLQTDIQSIL